jgi:hypothetical protein
MSTSRSATPGFFWIAIAAIDPNARVAEGAGRHLTDKRSMWVNTGEFRAAVS